MAVSTGPETLGFQTEAKQLLHLICLLYTSPSPRD